MNNLCLDQTYRLKSHWQSVCKPLLLMKLTTLIMLLMVVGVQAKVVAQKVTLSMEKAKMEDVLSAISKQTQYRFLYADELLKESDRVSISVKNASLEETMGRLLKGKYNYKVFAETVTITPVPRSEIDVKASAVQDHVLQSQNRITGTVRDSGGNALAGVTVAVRGTSIVVATDNAGHFSIVVEPNAELEISFVG